jgi:hypothetical protein
MKSLPVIIGFPQEPVFSGRPLWGKLTGAQVEHFLAEFPSKYVDLHKENRDFPAEIRPNR